MRSGWAGIRGRPPDRAAPGSRPAHGAPASASAVRTRTRLARGGAKAPGWPRARGWRSGSGLALSGLARSGLGLGSSGLALSGLALSGLALSGLALSGLALSGLALSGLALSGLAAGGGCGARRNHPAGGATPGQELSSVADSPAAGPSAAGSEPAPGHRRPAAGAGPEPSGLAARTRGGSDFPNQPSGTGLYAADLPPTANHDDDSHSTGHFLYSSQTPVQAHFRQNAILCRSSHFLVHTG